MGDRGPRHPGGVGEKRYADIGYDPPDVFRERIANVWRELVADPPGEHVVIGCHGGTIREIIRATFGEMPASFHAQLEYASICRFTVTDGRVSLTTLNETGHFDATRDSIRGAMNTALRSTHEFDASLRSVRRRQPLLRGRSAFTRHVDPKMHKRCMQWAQIDGRQRLLVGGKVNRFIPNPTFDPVARPGCLDDYFRGKVAKSDMREAFGELVPIPDEYRDRDAESRDGSAGA